MNLRAPLTVLVPVLALLSLALSSPALAQQYGTPQAVLLETVSTLTFVQGRMTAASRTTPIPQLNCIQGCQQAELLPLQVQCKNEGFDDYSNLQWSCTADLDSSVAFGVTKVSCEGFQRPGDRYVLQGSCALDYSLVATGRPSAYQGAYQQQGQGPRRYQNEQPDNQPRRYQNEQPYSNQQGTYKYDPNAGNRSSWLSNLFLFVIFGVVIAGVFRTVGQRNAGRMDGVPGIPPVGGPYMNPGNAGYPGGAGYPGAGTQVHGGGIFPGLRPGNWGWGGWGVAGLLGGALLNNRFNRGAPNVQFAPRTGNATYGGNGTFGGAAAAPPAGTSRTARTFATTESR